MTSLRISSLFPRTPDGYIAFGLGAAACLASGILLLILIFVFGEAWPALRTIGVVRFLSDGAWYPTDGAFGLVPMLAASFALAAGALTIAAPVGVAVAIFRLHYAPGWMKAPYRGLVLLLAGTPSVVLGLWGLMVLVPLIARIEPPGASLIAGILVLALMIVPTVAIASEAALESVPRSCWSAANALGLGREAALLNVVLPAAREGIAGGILLAGARALGETMVVLMITGNIVQMPDGLFTPVRALTSNIALEMAYATGDHRASLFVSGLALTLLVFLLSFAAGTGRRLRHA